jgi:hypothetical protein
LLKDVITYGCFIPPRASATMRQNTDGMITHGSLAGSISLPGVRRDDLFRSSKKSLLRLERITVLRGCYE